jgi:hypothetical protein
MNIVYAAHQNRGCNHEILVGVNDICTNVIGFDDLPFPQMNATWKLPIPIRTKESEFVLHIFV